MKEKQIKILALDPSSVETGYAIMYNYGGKITAEHYSTFKMPSHYDLGRRLNTTRENMQGLLSRNKPDIVACEDQFGGKNQKTLMTLREMVGVIRQICYEYGVTENEFFMYAPSTIKKCVTGHGKSSKQRVKDKVIERLGIQEDITNDNITDALSVGVTYFENK